MRASNRGTIDEAAERGWIDCALPFEEAHFETGFAHPDGRFRFKPDWQSVGPEHAVMPPMPDYMAAIEAPSEQHPFRLVVPPAPHLPEHVLYRNTWLGDSGRRTARLGASGRFAGDRIAAR